MGSSPCSTRAFYGGDDVGDGFFKIERIDITGTADALRHNPEVLQLLKLIWIKYRVFGSAPPEVQLLITTLSTAMVMRSQNAKKREISVLLNQKI